MSRIAPIIRDLVGVASGFFEQGVSEGVFRKLSALHTVQSAMGMAILHHAAFHGILAEQPRDPGL